jgi:hypothetical protein
MAPAGVSRVAHALAQGRLEVDRPAVLVEEISECLVSELTKVLHAVPGEQVEGVPYVS